MNDFVLATSFFAETVTAARGSTKRNFPFVRVPNFESSARYSRRVTNTEIIAWVPFVAQDQRAEWSDFVSAEKGWYDESKQIEFGGQESDLLTSPVVDPNNTIREYIWQGENISAPSQEVFAPVWQVSPPPYSLSLINYNILSSSLVADMLPVINQTRDGLMSANSPFLLQLLDRVYDPAVAHGSFREQDEDVVGERPHSIFVEPVFEALNNSNSSLVGLVVSVLSWDDYLDHEVLPDGVRGIVLVLKNTCGQSFSYILNGRMVCTERRGIGSSFTGFSFSFLSPSYFHLLAAADIFRSWRSP